MRKFRSEIRSGEILAVRHDPRNLAKSRSDILDMLMADPVVDNEERDGFIVVTIRGTLEQNACGYGDSYAQIRERWTAAVGATPDCIVLKIDSGGGAVAGLNQLVYDMRRMAEESGIHVIAYLDEMAASAAYAIATVADEIVLPPSGLAGSIGVISFMVDTVEADKKAGLNWITLTSGERKDDGHPHTTISRAAANAEQDRVDELARQFFALVKERRGVNAQPLQAALFLGQAAVDEGLADEVAGWEKLLVQVTAAYGSGEMAQSGTPPEANMKEIQALIAQTRKALAAAVTVGKRAELAAQLSSYESTLKAMKKTKYVKEEETSEESDDHEDEDKKEESAEEEESDEEASAAEDDKKEKKSKKAHAAEDDKKEDASASEEEDEEASAEEDDDDKEAKALLSSPGRAAAVLAKARAFDALQGDVAKLKAKSVRDERASMIAKAKLPPALAKRLAKKPIAYVKDFIADMKGTTLAALSTEEDFEQQRNPSGGIDMNAQNGDVGIQMKKVLAAAAAAIPGMSLEQLEEMYRKTPPTRPNGVKLGGN